MNGGIQIFNDKNSIQVDSSYRNLSLARKVAFGAGRKQTYANPSTLIRAIYSEGGTFVMPDYGGANSYKVYGASGTFYEYEFMPYRNGNFGFEVFDENGNLCFTSNDKPLRVLDHITGVIPNGDNQVILDKTYSGKKCAIAIGQQPMSLYARSKDCVLKALKVTTQQSYVLVEYNEAVVENVPARGIAGNPHYNFLVIDISNY